MTKALERDFPLVEISQIAEQESWRKEINRPIYHIHKWWATRLGSVLRAITLSALRDSSTNTWRDFYREHDLRDKVVLDPFMGSGTTIGEAAKLGAKAIGCDINPISTFLVREAFTRVSESDLRAAYRELEQTVAADIRACYQTRDPVSGESIPVLYFFWVKTVETPEGETIPLLSRYVFAQDAYPRKKPWAQLVCPSCWQVFEDRYDAQEAKCPHCAHAFNPQIGPASGQYVVGQSGARYRIKDLLEAGAPPSHRLYAMLALRPTGEKVYLAPTDEDLRLYAECEERLHRENLPLPTMEVRSGHNTDQARGYGYLQWRDFFNARQLLCLGLLLKGILRIENVEVREQLLCLFSSTLEFNNLFCSFKGEGTGAVRHMFSNHILKPERAPLENSVWGGEKSSGTFSTLFESRLLKAKRYLDEPFELAFERNSAGEKTGTTKLVASLPLHGQLVDSWEALRQTKRGLMLLNGDSSRLPLPDECVDAVVTDPPYFDFIHYSELSDFFFAWLSPVLRDRYEWFDRDNSADRGEVQNKEPRTFARQLASVLSECRRVLKDDGVLAFSFHHSRAEGWAAIYEAVKASGLVVVAAHPVHAELKGASPKTAAKSPISIDAILVCKKKSGAGIAHCMNWPVVEKTRALATTLQEGGLQLSESDWFVIGASQAIVAASAKDLSFDAMASEIDRLRPLFLSEAVEPGCGYLSIAA